MPNDETPTFDRARLAALISATIANALDEPSGGLLSDPHAITNASWATSSPLSSTSPLLTLEAMTSTARNLHMKYAHLDHQVCEYDGTPAEFFAEARRQGVVLDATAGAGWMPGGYGLPVDLGGLEVVWLHGKTYAGTRKAIDNLMEARGWKEKNGG